MSEQLVIILLIALTLVIVLIALAIPDETTPGDGSIETEAPATIQHTDEVSDVFDADELQSAVLEVNEEQGVADEDARRAADVPEEAGR